METTLGQLQLSVGLVAVVAAGLYWRLQTPVTLTDKDVIVLAEFTNTTGDPVFDGTLRQGLLSQLEQSPFLSFLTDEQIAKTLALMDVPRTHALPISWRATSANALGAKRASRDRYLALAPRSQ